MRTLLYRIAMLDGREKLLWAGDNLKPLWMGYRVGQYEPRTIPALDLYGSETQFSFADVAQIEWEGVQSNGSKPS